jgi:hypothetical protein
MNGILDGGWWMVDGGLAAQPLWRSSYALHGSGGTGKDGVGRKNFGLWILNGGLGRGEA